MGCTTGWLRHLCSHKKPSSRQSLHQKPRPATRAPVRVDEQDRRDFYREAAALADDPDEQSKRAIAVAAATAAVAEAAVAAAHAAAAVVRLTGSGRCGAVRREGEEAAVAVAAIKIQSAFRGYLARRALKALRGLVKLQALARGYIVRKQAAETLRCMHALVRVQARARSSRVLGADYSKPDSSLHPNPVPSTPEKYEHTPRSNGSRSARLSPLKRNSNKSIGSGGGKLGSNERSQSSRSNWLDQWIEEKYWDDERTDKILEIDTGKPKYGSKRQTNRYVHHPIHSCSTHNSDPNSFSNVQESPSGDSTAAQISVPSTTSIAMERILSPIKLSTVTSVLGESPQFYSATSRATTTTARRGPFTPAKSECSFGGYTDYPNYMANTESFRAKARSQSAPKQRPENERFGSGRRVLSSSHGAVLAQNLKSGSLIQSNAGNNNGYFGSGRLDKYGMPVIIRY